MKQAAIILFYDKNGNILLQDRKDISKHEEYGFFGGKLEPGENADQALKRELKEELDYDIEDFKLYKEYIFFSNQKKDYRKRFFYLASMPEISKLKEQEGKIFLTTFNKSFTLKMRQGHTELLREVQKYLLDNKLINY